MIKKLNNINKKLKETVNALIAVRLTNHKHLANYSSMRQQTEKPRQSSNKTNIQIKIYIKKTRQPTASLKHGTNRKTN